MIELNKLVFNTAIAEIVTSPTPNDFKHPFIKIAKFVLADDKPNQNKQGIKAEDFDEVIASAVGMPVKMRFNRLTGLQNHTGSIPIGHITSVAKETLDDGTNRLIASAALWSDEYPEEIEFLQKSYDDGSPPQISYEMAYADSVTEDGTQWIKKVTTLAATFVKTPAYGSRTALLALASAEDISLPELAKEIVAIAKAEEEKNITKGGMNVDEKELKELQDKLAKTEKDLELARTEASTKAETITTLEAKIAERDTQIQTLTDEKNSLVKAQLIDSRVRKLSDNGITLEADAEKAAKKKEFWASMSEDDFNEYLSDLVSARKSTSGSQKIALASLQQNLPKPDSSGGPVDLLSAVRSLKN